MKSIKLILLAGMTGLVLGQARASTGNAPAGAAGEMQGSRGVQAAAAGALKHVAFEAPGGPALPAAPSALFSSTAFLAAEPGEADPSSAWFLFVASIAALGVLSRRRMARD